MKQLAGIVFFAIVFLSLQACNDNRKAKNYNDTVIDEDAQNFISKGAEGLSTGIQLSQIAIKTATNPAIVDFAKGALKADKDALDDLKKLASAHSIKTTDTLSKAHMQMIAELEKKSGAGFNKQYTQAMVEDNEHAIELFKTVSGNPNKNVAAFANKLLPKLREQLKTANDICTGLQ